MTCGSNLSDWRSAYNCQGVNSINPNQTCTLPSDSNCTLCTPHCKYYLDQFDDSKSTISSCPPCGGSPSASYFKYLLPDYTPDGTTCNPEPIPTQCPSVAACVTPCQYSEWSGNAPSACPSACTRAGTSPNFEFTEYQLKSPAMDNVVNDCATATAPSRQSRCPPTLACIDCMSTSTVSACAGAPCGERGTQTTTYTITRQPDGGNPCPTPTSSTCDMPVCPSFYVTSYTCGVHVDNSSFNNHNGQDQCSTSGINCIKNGNLQNGIQE